MKKYSKLMAVLLVVAMLLPGIAQAAPVTEQAKVMRVGGETRVETSIKVSEVAMDTATDAVLVGYNGEADALTGAIVAKAKNAPLFYVRASEVEAVKARLDDLGVANVHILGGTTVFTKELMKEFDAYNPTRIDGDNRYETAINAAEVAVGKTADTVFLAKGNGDLADALAIGAISAKESTPLLLTHAKSLTDVTKQALADMGVKNIEIIGGKTAVTEEVKEELEELGYTVGRTGGNNRQGTSVEIAKKFNPEAAELVIANGFEYADAVTAGYFAATRNAVVLLTNTRAVDPTVKAYLEANKLDTTVLGEKTAIPTKIFDEVVEYLDGVEVEMPEEGEDVELEVESVSAINAKTLEVTFNKEADVKAADFSVNKGTIKTNIADVVLSEDKTTATLELTSRMTEGKYTVTVAQEDAEDLVASVDIENEKVTEIKVLSDVAPLSRDNTASDKKATATVQILNQYGEDVTKMYASEVTETPGGVATKAELDTKGKLTFTLATTAKAGDNVMVTLVHGKTGVNTQATLELTAKPLVSEITFGELYNKDGKTLSQDTNTSKDNFYLPVEFKDQYGEKVESKSVIDEEVLFTNTNPAIVKLKNADKVVEKTIDGKEMLVLELGETGLAGTVNIVAVSTTSGESTTKAITVEEGVTFASVAIGQPERVATAGEAIYFPLTVIDSEGNEITTKKDLDAIGQDELNVSDNVTLVYEDADENKGLFLKTGTSHSENDAVTVSVTTKKGKVATQTVVVKEAAEATVITGIDAKKATALREGSNGVTIESKDLTIEDQYGQEMADTSGVKFTAVASNTASGKTLNVIKNSDTSFTVKPQTDFTETSGKVTFKLNVDGMENKDKEASAFEQTFTIVKDSEFESYKIEDVNTIYAPKSNEADGDTGQIKTGYDQEIVVKAVTASGEEVELNASEYTVKGKLGTDAGDVKYADADAETKTVTVTVTINATGDEITKELVYSNVAPKVAEVKLVKEGDVKDAEGALKSDKALVALKEVTEIDFVGKKAFDIAALLEKVDFVVVDTYGQVVAHESGASTVTLDDNQTPEILMTLSNPSKDVEFEANGANDAAVVEFGNESTFNALVKVGNVSSNKVKVTVADDGAYSATAVAEEAKLALKDAVETAFSYTGYMGDDYEDAETLSNYRPLNSLMFDGTTIKANPEAADYNLKARKGFTANTDSDLIANMAIKAYVDLDDDSGNAITIENYVASDVKGNIDESDLNKYVVNTLGRYLGALGRIESKPVTINFGGTSYTWDISTKEFKGSNWKDMENEEATLVKAITESENLSPTMKLVDGDGVEIEVGFELNLPTIADVQASVDKAHAIHQPKE